MKTAAIIAILCGVDLVSGARYNKAEDPCQALDKKACQDESACHYQMGERKHWLSRKESPNHHHEEAGKQSCQMIHMKDRTNLSKEGKESLEKFGAHSEWDDMECAEAFYMKDCKDLNQNAVMNGSEVHKCAWNYKTGCMNYDGETRVYDIGCGKDGGEERLLDGSCPISKPNEFLIDLYNAFDPNEASEFCSDDCERSKFVGRTVLADEECHKEDLGAFITVGGDPPFNGPTPEVIDTCANICYESVATGDCAAYTIEEIVVTIRLIGGPNPPNRAHSPPNNEQFGYELFSEATNDVCLCFPPMSFGVGEGNWDVGVSSLRNAGCENGYNSYIHPDNSQKDTYIGDATKHDCDPSSGRYP